MGLNELVEETDQRVHSGSSKGSRDRSNLTASSLAIACRRIQIESGKLVEYTLASMDNAQRPRHRPILTQNPLT